MRLFKLHPHWLLALSIAAGLLYSSWPLGYWLNPSVSSSSLASGLEAVGQPYNWLFISGDILSSLLVILLCYLMWLIFRHAASAKLVSIALIFAVLYAIGTIVDALLPERCVPNLEVCPDISHDHLLLVHGFFSITASVFLFVSLFVIWLKKRRSLILNGLILGYVIFGLISLVQAIIPGNNGNWSQHYYITLCSVWLALIPYAVSLIVIDSPKQTSEP